MKTILMAASALSLLAAPAAFAQSADSTVSVTGTVAGLCGIGNQSGGGTASASAVTYSSLIDANGFLNAAEQEITFGNIWCNAPATLSLEASALSTPVTVLDTGSFVNTLDLHVSGKLIDTYFITVADGSSAKTGTPLNSSIPAAFETGTGQYSKAKLNVTLPAGTVGQDRPVAGAYTGSVTLTVTPTA
jgi:hypothetical protein